MSNASHRKAWMGIAEAFGTPTEERTHKQNRIASFGICGAAIELSQSHFGLDGCHGKNYSGYWWTLTDYHDQYRSLSAMLIAEMGEEEFRMLREEK